MNLFSAFEEVALRQAGKTALVFEGEKISYTHLLARTISFAEKLSVAGVRSGDPVAVYAGTSVEVIACALALFRLQAVPVPVNHHYQHQELLHIIRDSGSRVLLTDNARLQVIKEVIPEIPHPVRVLLMAEGDVASVSTEAPEYSAPFSLTKSAEDEPLAALFYTSGTTGKSKGAKITHGNILSNLEALHACWRWTADDVLLLALPLHHVHGFIVALLGALLAGNTIILHSCFNAAKALQDLEQYRCTLFMGVPTMYHRMLQTGGDYDVSHMRLFLCGSAALSGKIFHGFADRFGFEILERAGMTETLMNFSNPVQGPRIPGSVGKALPGVQVKVVDESLNEVPFNVAGQITIKSPSVFQGYLHQTGAAHNCFHNGWFLTGDIGTIDENGYVRLISRMKDVIKFGGTLVFPKEIEDVIAELPGVAECAVVGIPDEEYGESIAAFVVADRQPFRPETVQQHCAERLASFKKPAVVKVLTALPRNQMGKVLKQELRQMVFGYSRQP